MEMARSAGHTPAPVETQISGSGYRGDFNHDGKADLAAASGNRVVVMLGTGEATFQSAASYAVGGTEVTAVSVLAGDFNHDGTIDLAAISQNPKDYNLHPSRKLWQDLSGS